MTHVDSRGAVRMVEVGDKPVTARVAVAAAEIHMSASARRAIRDRAVAKGDPLQTARIAGVMGAKRTADLIPLCHPLPISGVTVTLTPKRWGYAVSATVRTTGQTGVEMEALTAVSVAALTVYDMCKAVERTMRIEDVRLVAKSGGKSGDFRAE